MLEKTLESPLDSREIKPILKEINPEYSLEYYSPDAKNGLIGKDPDAGKD